MFPLWCGYRVCVWNNIQISGNKHPDCENNRLANISCYCFAVQVRILFSREFPFIARKTRLIHLRVSRTMCTPREKCFHSRNFLIFSLRKAVALSFHPQRTLSLSVFCFEISIASTLGESGIGKVRSRLKVN